MASEPLREDIATLGEEREDTTLRTLEHVARAWAREASEEQILEMLGREIERILPCDRAYMLQYSEEAKRIVTGRAYGEGPDSSRLEQELSRNCHIVELLEGNLDVVVCNDTRMWSNDLERQLAEEGIRSYIGLVLEQGNPSPAVLLVASRKPLAYGAGHVRLLRQLAPALSMYLWRARQHVKRSAEEKREEDERERLLVTVVGGVAHYFSNMLASIMGGLELLSDCRLDEEGRALVERLQGRAEEWGQMVRALQQFATMEPPENLEDIQMSELVEEVIELTRPIWENVFRAGGRRIRVHHRPLVDARIRGNRRDLREALINVLFNAIEAIPDSGNIWITEGREGMWCYIEVMDEGVGMSKEVAKRAKEPFFTTQRGRRQGLGLSVTSGIMRRHGGEVSIISEPGKGTVVRLSFPATM